MTSDSAAARYLHRSTELLWGTGQRPIRGPKPGLTRDAIVDAAITVADAEGADGLSMRKIAAELGAGTMSLYRYVPGKAELLDLVLDRISDPAKVRAQAAGRDWRRVLEVMARESYATYLAHPWLLQVNWSRPIFGPNTLAGVEIVIGSLTDLGLTDQERVELMIVLDSYVTGMARQQILQIRAGEESGISDDEFWAHQAPVLERAMATGDYPALAALAADSFSAGWEETFEFGLARVLDGFAALLARRGPAGPG